MPHRRSPFAVSLVLLVVLASAASAANSVVLPRPGQVGIGIQGEYGTLLNTGGLGGTFDSGPGIAVRLRYRLRYERAIGLSFEGQQIDSRQTGAPGDTTAQKLSLTLSGLEVYQMFGTESRTVRNLCVGAGLAHPTEKTFSDESTFPQDGVYVSAGAGIEHFFFSSWAYDISTRYFAIFQNQKTNHDFQVSAGLIFYASY